MKTQTLIGRTRNRTEITRVRILRLNHWTIRPKTYPFYKEYKHIRQTNELEMKGIEPLTSRMQIVRSTPELHPHKRGYSKAVAELYPLYHRQVLFYDVKNQTRVPPLGIEPRTFRLLSERSTTEPRGQKRSLPTNQVFFT